MPSLPRLRLVRIRARFAAAAVVGVALVALVAACGETPPASDVPAKAGFGPPTEGVDVALHPHQPLDADRTVVWTVAFQAAWDALSDALGDPAGIELAPPADPEDVAALNAGRLAPGVVDTAALTTIVGPATEETWSRIDSVSETGRPDGAPSPSELDLVAFARLEARVRYAVPFMAGGEPLLFGPRGAPVRSWGAWDARGPDGERMCEQLELHVPEGERDAERPGAFVAVLRGDDGARVVLSSLPAQATLDATWRAASSVIAATPARELSGVDRFQAPRVGIVAESRSTRSRPRRSRGDPAGSCWPARTCGSPSTSGARRSRPRRSSWPWLRSRRST